ncbi:gamma-glutamyl-gamma-aminobutyrate hydrolase family protein [Acidaminobacter sp. JC074]|uniref:gamma-glutamyl-gamma-aminobutyrate hydrolase family protein n=1 Tax=Acidaminobacter sp. JC074 TaxID=2530199 RepID=UPI001F10DBED|nr:gamma-glutamyl-gamma-aminobutyrate hydrolase family protein [Acidaminobacter sp. JC074]MCH4886836.1 gamma-glutamyl-gamma-aminobutyrate hydrolase family protein [Acidaminobacter sp. JC074]
MKKPVIGISGSITILESGRFPGYRRTYVNEDYVKSVILAGGVPLLLPLTTDPEIVKGYLDLIDGLVLSGGHDVSPLAYGEQPLQKIGHTLPERDVFDRLLIETALEKKLPLLGICRGMQILNVALGGTLYQDLDYVPDSQLKHDQYHDPSLATHEVSVDTSSKLFNIMGDKRVKTNSFHHLAVKDLGEGLVITAKADDGVVEAIEHNDYPFVLGVQWHPEMMASTDVKMKSLFEALMEAVLKK